jgi:DNA-binding response OmpR family regulator
MNRSSLAAGLTTVVSAGVPANHRGSVALLIGDDPRAAETVRWALRAMGLETTWTRNGLQGLTLARRGLFDLVLVDLAVAGVTGPDVLQALQVESQDVRVIGVGDISTMSKAADVVMGSVSGVLEKPFNTSGVIAVVNTVLQHASPSPTSRAGDSRVRETDHAIPALERPGQTPRSAAERWAYLVLRALDSRVDPKTIATWARVAGVSRSVISECCALVYVQPRDARDFARLMRVVCHSGHEWRPEAVLDVADGRTLHKLLLRGGVSGRVLRTPTMPEFLARQRWVARGNSGFLALQALLFGDRAVDA